MPRHLTIQQDLLKKIQSGVYPQGQLIPKECELTEIYQVSRPTVRQAIQQLVNDGYLERRKRRGTIVKQQKISQEFTHIIESYDSEMNRKGLHPKTKVLTFKLDKANADIANNLQINENEDVYKLVRLRYAESKPVVLVTTYLPAKLLPNFINNDFTQEKLYSVLQKMDFPILQIRRKLEVLKADETTGDLLDIEASDPIFYFHSIAFTHDRIPIEYSISKYRGDINSFVFELNHAS
ncbi:GntR family transcriptional regulator [Gilliamella apicola]|uniref:GntR family transcriptional regulator n=1 Tax=Gilliamella apicola TaxID=1196095 RepID=UPI002FEE5787